MKIILDHKLDDPKFCDGCPLLYDYMDCNADFEGFKLQYLEMRPGKKDRYDNLRPQECIERFGL